MAFHVACPITWSSLALSRSPSRSFLTLSLFGCGSRRICYCELGFPAELKGERARSEFLAQIEALEGFLRDPWTVRVDGGAAAATVQVLVPKVAPPPPPPPVDGEEARRVAVKRQAAAATATASLAAESFSRRLEAGGAAADVPVPGQVACHMAGDDQSSSVVKVMCHICFSGENEGSERAVKMLSCKTCDKKYHRSCLKSWAEYRDLFHWSSWACPSCRICEVCRRTGDPNKLMFCKRCDGASHCYCQQPPHKNVSRGPYLCGKHTRCHSCGSTAPGNGPSTRWFLGYTCCDACGRLFVKGNYCPVCLKVYRDSETTPMVCCDVCERWVHCSCDGISDERYQQFQVDQTLQYQCAACRGDCFQVKDISDAVRELWQRRDTADRDQIASRRAAAGLPSEEELFSLSPDSDDEPNSPVILENDVKKPLKLSVKGISDKLTNNADDNGKSISRVKQFGSSNGNFIEGAAAQNAHIVPKVKIKGSKLQNLHLQNFASNIMGKSETLKGTKLVIHIGSRNRTVSGSPKSETSSCHRDQDIDASYRSANSGQQRTKDSKEHILSDDHVLSVRHNNGEGAQLDDMNQMQSSKHRLKTKNVIKLGKVSDMHHKNNGNVAVDECPVTCSSPLVIRKRNEEVTCTAESAGKATVRGDGVLPKKPSVDTHVYVRKEKNDTPSVQLTSKFSSDPKPLLKLKFKNPYFEQRSSWAPQGEEENSVKGQRSKRKRPSAEKVDGRQDACYGQQQQETPIDEAMDADWILQKLGKSAIGKRVEVHQTSDDSWQQGVVSDVFIGTSSLSVHLDDGRFTTVELGKQGIRFISQKQKRAKT